MARIFQLLPFPVLLVVAGAGAARLPFVPAAHLTPGLVLLLVPALVFEGALTADLGQLRVHALSIGLLASAGVVMTVLSIGAVTHYALHLAWGDGLLLGAILAPTDPIAVVSLVRRLGAPAGVAAILEGESLFNDGTGVALFTAVLATLASGSPSVARAAAGFVVQFGGGLAAGLAVGGAGSWLVRRLRPAPLLIVVTLALAYLAYAGSQRLGVSGIVAVVATGLVVGRIEHRIDGLWRRFAGVLNAVLFIGIGLALPAGPLAAMAGAAAVAFLVVVVVRAAPVYLLLQPADAPWRWRHLIWGGGLRGALGIALALSVAGLPGVSALVTPLAYGVIVLTIAVQGALLRPLAAGLRLTSRT